MKFDKKKTETIVNNFCYCPLALLVSYTQHFEICLYVDQNLLTHYYKLCGC